MSRTVRNLRRLLDQVYPSYVLVHPYFCRVDFEDWLNSAKAEGIKAEG